jgi:hypothetical protein
MAILGTLMDVTTVSWVADAVTGAVVTRYAHSLPATNPEVVIPVIRSIEAVGGGTARAPTFFGLGGNASFQTVGRYTASNVTVPTVMFDILAIVFHSVVR